MFKLKRSTTCLLLGWIGYWGFGGQAWSQEDPRILTSGAEVRQVKAQANVARMRLGVTITPYKKYMVKNRMGKIEGIFKTLTPLRQNLRARVDRNNHFYVDEWHIETKPIAWKKATREIKVQFKFYRQYGKDRHLEQYVGTAVAAGKLVGQDFIYDFTGKQSVKLSNVLAEPIIDVLITNPTSRSNKNVAKTEQPAPTTVAKGAL